MTVKAVLNPRRDEAEFYNSIVTPTDVILRRGEGVDVIEVENDILEEAAAAASFAKLTGVFDKAPDVESPPPVDRTIPQEPNPSIPNAALDKLASEVAQLKANQLDMMASHVFIKANQAEIKAKLDLVLQLEQKLLDLFQVFSQKEDRPTVSTSAIDEADRAFTSFQLIIQKWLCINLLQPLLVSK